MNMKQIRIAKRKSFLSAIAVVKESPQISSSMWKGLISALLV
jgi:hypothetical protein